MPDIVPTLCCDRKVEYKYLMFIADELKEYMESIFPFFTRCEDNFIAGVSFGGFDAILGVPADIYAKMIRMAKKRKIRTLLDASEEPLLRGVEEVPFALKPNQDEIGLILNKKVETLEEAAFAAKVLINRGVEVCCVSLGELGAVLVTREHTYLAPALKVEVKGIQGAGDSLVAGMTIAMMQGRSNKEILQYAMAAAGGSVMREGTLMCTKENFERLLEQVEIMEV